MAAMSWSTAYGTSGKYTTITAGQISASIWDEPKVVEDNFMDSDIYDMEKELKTMENI